MNRRDTLSLCSMTVLALALTAGPAAAQLAKDLVGTWSLATADAFGANPKGSATFGANGRFSIILMRAALPKYASNNRTQGAAADYKATVEGSLAYFGTYSVSGTDLLLHIEGSTFPNWTGSDQKRINLAITGDELKYVQPTPSGGGPAAPVAWKRVK